MIKRHIIASLTALAVTFGAYAQTSATDKVASWLVIISENAERVSNHVAHRLEEGVESLPQQQRPAQVSKTSVTPGITKEYIEVVTYAEPPVIVSELSDFEFTRPLHHFSWGAELSSLLELTGQDMTAVSISALVGYKSRFVRFAGIGGGIRMMTTNSSRAYPLYALFRSGFSSRPTLCFMEAKAGVVFNNFYNDINRTSPMAGLGIGVTLARGHDFTSHIILSYEYQSVERTEVGPMYQPLADLHYAVLTIGIAF